jgi:acyl carrier protein
VAAIVPRESVSLSSGNLREFLKDRLPEHMIPSAFVFLDVLPRGPNGKVNRHALTMPDWMPSQRSSKYAAPRTELEELIVGLWEDSLGLETVGIHDDFFDLGGHSLLLGQIVSKLQTTFRTEIRLEDFLRNPTVAVLAQVIGTNFQIQHGLMTPIAAASREDPIPLSFAQERLWFLTGPECRL